MFLVLLPNPVQNPVHATWEKGKKPHLAASDEFGLVAKVRVKVSA